MRVAGEVVLLTIWDTGGEIDLRKVERIIGASPRFAGLRLERAAPEYITITPLPLYLELKQRTVDIFGKPRQIAVAARIYSVGAVALQIRIRVAEELGQLVRWSRPFKIASTSARAYAAEIFKGIFEDLRPALSELYPREEIPEEYTVICLTRPVLDAQKFLAGYKPMLAGILREEPSWRKLHPQEVEAATSSWISYFRNSLAVIDWSAALIMEPSGSYEDTLMAIELANLQLLELRTYDGLIDKRIDKAYDDIYRAVRGFTLLPRYSRIAADIAAMRTGLTRYIEDTMNISKFFGDYTLAKLYDLLEGRLHIKEWYGAVTKKLATLAELYRMATDRVEAQRAALLEVLIILLIAFEIVLALRGVL